MRQQTSFRKILQGKNSRRRRELVVFFLIYFLFSLHCVSQPNSCEPIWQSPIRLSFDSVLSISPGITTSGDTLHVIWYGMDTIGGIEHSGIGYCRSTDGGNSFSNQMTIVSSLTAFLPGIIVCSGNVVCIAYFGSANGSTGMVVIRSTDAGTTWQLPQLLKSNAFPRAMVRSGSNFFIHYGLQTSTQNGLIASTDNGASWNIRTSNMPSLQAIRIVSDTFHGVGEYDFGLHHESGYYYSTDQGVSWIGPQPISQENSVPSISPNLSVGEDGTIYTTWNDTGTIMMRRSIGHDMDGNIIFGNDIVLSDKPGAVFSTIVSSGPFVSVVWDNNDSGSNTIRLRSSNNNAVSFCPVDTPSVSDQASEPSMDVNGTHLYIVWSENIEGNVEIVERKGTLQFDLRLKKPKNFDLAQNYPNPVNGTTYISYNLPTSTTVSLKVYDILGQLVATLIDEVQPASTYSIPFSTGRLASGVYFYRIKAFPFTETKKIVVLR